MNNVPKKISKDERLNLPDDGLGSGNIYILLPFHEILDDFFGLIEMIDMPEIAILKDMFCTILSKRILAFLYNFIKTIVLCKYINGKESFLLEDEPEHSFEVFILSRSIQ